MAQKKRRKNPNPTAETLRDLEESGDRLAQWAADHALLILGVIAALLVLAGGVGLYTQHGETERDEAADALALASSQYRQAMGADPVGGPIPEPANPELAERTRSEFVERFKRVATAHTGTTSGAIAWLEAGQLESELGRLEDAAGSFVKARDAVPGSAVAALGAVRLAGLAEDRGDFAVAAEAYEAATKIEDYPLRAGALADAARTWAAAGETERAIAAYQRLESEFPDTRIPPPVTALISELRLAQD